VWLVANWRRMSSSGAVASGSGSSGGSAAGAVAGVPPPHMSPSGRPINQGPPHLDNGNTVWISSHKRLSFYVDIALRMFVQHEIVVLHVLGAAIAATVEEGQHLVHMNKATVEKISTSSVPAPQTAPKPEIVIVLKRTGIPTILPPVHPDEEAILKMHESKDLE